MNKKTVLIKTFILLTLMSSLSLAGGNRTKPLPPNTNLELILLRRANDLKLQQLEKTYLNEYELVRKAEDSVE